MQPGFPGTWPEGKHPEVARCSHSLPKNILTNPLREGLRRSKQTIRTLHQQDSHVYKFQQPAEERIPGSIGQGNPSGGQQTEQTHDGATGGAARTETVTATAGNKNKPETMAAQRGAARKETVTAMAGNQNKLENCAVPPGYEAW